MMFKYIISIVFSIMSVSNIFSAEKTCKIYFYELNPPFLGSFSISDGLVGILYELKNSDFVEKKNCICEFLKKKFIEKYNGYSESLLKYYYIDNGSEFIMGNGSFGTGYLEGEINDERSSEVAEIIDKSFNDETSVKVYFYPHDLPDKTSKASKIKTDKTNKTSKKDKADNAGGTSKIKTDKDNKPSKAKTGRASKKTKDVGKGPVIDYKKVDKGNQKENTANNVKNKNCCRCCNKS